MLKKHVQAFKNHTHSSLGLLGYKHSAFGFTLAELLIALAILGVIATFTIPKVLQSQQDSRFNSIAKEAIAAVSGAYQLYKVNNMATAATTFGAISPYLNYVKDEAPIALDSYYNDTTYTCTSVCLRLHNGAVLNLAGGSFGGTASTNAISFFIDPDGKVTAGGAATGPGKGIELWLFYDGKVRDRGSLQPNACDSGSCYNAYPASVPPWFSW